MLETLSETTVKSIEGEVVPVGSLWKDRRVVLVWLRHFGWMYCREQVVQLHGVVDEIRDKGAELIAIGSGSAEHARWFIEADGVDFPVYLDSRLASYEAAGLERSSKAVGGLTPLVGGIKRFLGGARNRGIKGDVLQQGGVMVVGPEDRVIFAHRNQHLEDMANLDDVLAAL